MSTVLYVLIVHHLGSPLFLDELPIFFCNAKSINLVSLIVMRILKIKMKKLNSLFLFLIMNVGLFAQTTTISSGNWNAPGNWTSGVPGNETATINNSMNLNVSLNVGNGADYTFNEVVTDAAGGASFSIDQNGTSILDVNANLTIESNYDLGGFANLIVRAGDTLRLGGDFSAKQNTYIQVEPDGVIIIEGDLDLKQNTSFLIDGNVLVEGDVSTKQSSSLTGAGKLEVNGSVDMKQSSSIFGSTSNCSNCSFGSGAGLPIDLISFSAEPTSNKGLKVNWSTATEIINDYFLIEVSIDGDYFVEFGRENGAGNSTEKKVYSLVDQLPFDNITGVYVRMTQFDFDGNSEPFDPVYVSLEQETNQSNSSFTVYPNPGNGDQVNLKLEGMESGTYVLQLLSLNGQIIQDQNVNISDSTSEVKLNINNNLGRGIYFLRLANGTQNIITKYLVH